MVEPLAAGRGPVHLVDAGCGLGYTLRWLAAYGRLDPRVEFVGLDLNTTLIGVAQDLARQEALPCRFESSDVRVLREVVADPTRSVVISNGLLHHLEASEVGALLSGHQQANIAAFAHWDLVPSRWSVLGAWVFHRSRMREGISRHDGVLSARRAWPAGELLEVATAVAGTYRLTCADPNGLMATFSGVLRPLTGVRKGL